MPDAIRIFPTMRRGACRRRRTGRKATLAALPEDPPMIDLNHIDDLARRLSSLVPPGLRGDASQDLRDELQQNFKSVLQSGLSRLDLVTREEFEVQRAVLLRIREKLEQLQRAVTELEAQLGNAAPDPASAPPRH